MKCSLENKCKNCIPMKDGCYFTGKAIWNEVCLYFKTGGVSMPVVVTKAMPNRKAEPEKKVETQSTKAMPKSKKATPETKATPAKKTKKKSSIHEI
jgi:hypothetical protein